LQKVPKTCENFSWEGSFGLFSGALVYESHIEVFGGGIYGVVRSTRVILLGQPIDGYRLMYSEELFGGFFWGSRLMEADCSIRVSYSVDFSGAAD
jgi:hypothetical protein